MLRFLLLILSLLCAPLQAAVPVAPPSASQSAEPDAAQKKAAYAALADVLENDAARKELIAQLRSAAAAPPAQATAALTPPPAQEDKTVLENLSLVGRQFSDAFSSRFAQLWRNISGEPHKRFNPQTFTNALTHFLMLAALVFALYGLLRLAVLPLMRRMGHWGRKKNHDRSSWLHLPATILGAFALDMLLLALTLFVGELVSDKLNAGNATIAFQQSLLLNAFALIEFFKAVLRLIFSPQVPDLRPFTLREETARYWCRHLSALSSMTGYGLIVAVPIISNQVNVQAGALANLVIMLSITLWGLWLIAHNKKAITRGLVDLADRSLPFFSLCIRIFSHIWHWLAVAYFLVLFFFSLFDPGNSLKYMMSGSLKSLATVAIAAFVSGILSRWIAKTITLSPEMRRSYPELQKRLNGWISVSLKAARILTVCVAIMLLLNAWGLFDLTRWLHSESGEKVVDVLIRIALILFFSAVGWTLLASLIENQLASDHHGRPLPSARARTLLSLFRNAIAVVITTITVMILLSEIGVNIAPLLAGAGALGLAVSFGAQTLVKDIITGIFIQVENGMDTGDLVTIGSLTGTVERMSIRSVGIRMDTGAYYIIPWSSISTFANFVRGIGSVVANYDVDRSEDTDRANDALKAAVSALLAQEDIRGLIIGEPSFSGLVGLTSTGFTLRVSFTTLPLKQWTVRYALDAQVKKHFDEAGIRAPVQTYQLLPGPESAPLPPGEAPTL